MAKSDKSKSKPGISHLKPTKLTSKLRRKPKSKAKSKSKLQKLPSTRRLLLQSIRSIRANWRPLLGVMIINIAIAFLFSSDTTDQAFSMSTFGAVLCAMAYIWILRQAAHDQLQPGIKPAFYQGASQIVPFMLMLILLIVQLLPLTIGGFIYQIAVNGTTPVAIYYWEKLLFAGLWVLLAVPSLYWLITTIISLILVAIPGVAPLEARRAAAQLTSRRLASIWWRVIMSVIIVGLVYGLIAAGLVRVWPTGYEYLLQFSGALSLPLIVVFFFELYESLRKAAD